MDKINFSRPSTPEQMAIEIVCLKSMISLMIRALGQADGGKVIINLEKLISQHDNKAEAEIFTQVIQEMRWAYRD